MAKLITDRLIYTINHMFNTYPTLRNKGLYKKDAVLLYMTFSIIAYKGSPGIRYVIYVNAPDEYTAYIFLLDMGYYDIQIQ